MDGQMNRPNPICNLPTFEFFSQGIQNLKKKIFFLRGGVGWAGGVGVGG